MSDLTGRQRYKQAVTKQRLKIARQVRAFQTGELHRISDVDDRTIFEEALDLAYSRGVERGRREVQEWGEAAERGKPLNVPHGNIKPKTSDIGPTRKSTHEAHAAGVEVVEAGP